MNVVRSMLALVRMAAREGRLKLVAALLLMLAHAAALPLSAVALGALTDAVVAGDADTATARAVVAAALVIAALTADHFAHIFYFEVGDAMMLRLERDVIELSNGSAGLEHHERPDYADKLQVLREEIGRTGAGALGALLSSVGLGVGMTITGAWLALVSPWLLLLPLASLPPLLLGRKAEALEKTARETAAPPLRRARHLLGLVTDPGSFKEVRTCGLEGALRTRRNQSWEDASRILFAGQLRGAGLHIAGQLIFGLAYVGATLFVISNAIAGRSTPGDVILAVALAGQVNQQVTAAITLHQQVQRTASVLSDISWMAALVGRRASVPDDANPPEVIKWGITFDNVGFAYPGTARKILDGITLRLAAGSTVAVVGENGAGKSTLVKLLCGFYEATSGTLAIDGVDLRRLNTAAWRERITAGFQDFARFEFLARQTVGLGHLPDIDSVPAVQRALERASSQELPAALEKGLDTPLGKSNTLGVELSGGQWQKLALSRAMMRDSPLLMVLDEPTSALDARAEHLLFERYAAGAKRVGKQTGAITVLVSHRFSTVRMADLILVVADGRVSEAGTHDHLIRQGGLYADLYTLQARAYQ